MLGRRLRLPSKVRNQPISFKIDYPSLEENRDYNLQAKRFDAAEFQSGIMKRRLEEIRKLEKEVAKLESICLVGER